MYFLSKICERTQLKTATSAAFQHHVHTVPILWRLCAVRGAAFCGNVGELVFSLVDKWTLAQSSTSPGQGAPIFIHVSVYKDSSGVCRSSRGPKTGNYCNSLQQNSLLKRRGKWTEQAAGEVTVLYACVCVCVVGGYESLSSSHRHFKTKAHKMTCAIMFHAQLQSVWMVLL